MDGSGAGLSPRERRILDEIAHDLGADASLARSLGGRGTRIRFRGGRLTGPAAVFLGSLALALFVAAVASGSPVLIWVFAAVWALTLVCLLRLLLRWSRRHLTGDERPRPDADDSV
ncbi:DUF3040 domain-containing protein [Streptomyces sp. NPDC004327]|uniref:DUF3040 domain-containing protein n=1 Tax=unclassified Streptomyces TaxID=2593676 RepID=UPI0036BACC90